MHDPDRRLRPSASVDAEPVRLLIADDDPAYCAFVAILARRLGFVASEAMDGEAALAELARAPCQVAVIDMEMPRLTGLDVIARIRADDSMKGLFAVMLTGREDLTTKLTALEAGFDDFMTKSSSEAELVAKLAASMRVAVRQRTRDIAIRELYGLATRDPLTAVFNRRFFLGETERMLAASTPLSVILFDLDGFKDVNDTFGHLAGDQILRDVGALFLRNTRSDDLVARYGGDEFVMVATSLGTEEVGHLAERLAADVDALQWVAGEETFGIRVTTGFALSQLLPAPTVEELLDAADRDLYKNKWMRKHPGSRPELYVYPASDRRVDLVPAADVKSRTPAPDPAPVLGRTHRRRDLR